MSKKHFKLLAEALKRSKPDEDGFDQWENDVMAIIDVCHISDPRFNKTKFLEACGYYDKHTS